MRRSSTPSLGLRVSETSGMDVCDVLAWRCDCNVHEVPCVEHRRRLSDGVRRSPGLPVHLHRLSDARRSMDRRTEARDPWLDGSGAEGSECRQGAPLKRSPCSAIRCRMVAGVWYADKPHLDGRHCK